MTQELFSDTNSSFDRLECILDEMERGTSPKPTPTPTVSEVVDLNDTEHDAPTTLNFMFDPAKALDPPLLTNSEILATLTTD
ncbi:MAG: uncharacterized protein KVP18_002770 [Porospora cf. gigantea A]|uniref:uncharacterized protein n=1 Tax=Porospora cf. gigantea A TaxID=2853593 RepID=UPI0035593BAB|nr:MAG: hypothetical protein KVP18_002770 [Porospora cf. gigantea A]